MRLEERRNTAEAKAGEDVEFLRSMLRSSRRPREGNPELQPWMWRRAKSAAVNGRVNVLYPDKNIELDATQ